MPGMLRMLRSPLRLFAPLKKVGYRLLFAVGVGVAVLFIAMALFSSGQAMGVLLATLGATLGVLIISMVLPKMMIGDLSRRHADLQQAMEQTLREKAHVLAEIERVRAQQLQVNQVQTVTRLTLLEIDTSITDFRREPLGSREKALGGSETLEYVGVLRKRCQILLGLDLERLRVHVQDQGAGLGRELLVDGVHPQFHGLRNDQEEWLLRQVQVQEDNLIMSNKLVVNQDAELLLPGTERHRLDLAQRLQNGVELSQYRSALERMAQQWLSLHLAPLGMTVRLSPLAAAQGVPLLDYLHAAQQQLVRQQQGLQSDLDKIQPDMSAD